MAESDAFYLELLEDVDPLFTEFGRDFQVRGPGVYDETTRTTGVGASREVMGIVVDQQTLNNLGSQIFAVDEKSQAFLGKKNLLLRRDANPDVKEEIEVDGTWFPLARVRPLKPAAILMFYVLDVSL